MTPTRTLAIATLLVAGCATTQDFVPTERATAVSPEGKTAAAEYEVESRSGAEIGEIKVWTEGAYEAEVDGRERTVVQIVFEVENQQDAPLTLSQVQLDGVEVDGARLDAVQPTRIEGPTTIAPGADARVRAYFTLPTAKRPNDVERFEVTWTVQKGDTTYRQRTPFVQQVDRYYNNYYTPYYYYYDPFLYDPWGRRGVFYPPIP